MKELQFITDIYCGRCIFTVESVLKQEPKIEKWEVDIMANNNPMTIKTSLSEQEVIDLIKSVGYIARPISDQNLDE